eukprot:TRINITY_DN33731_c0_g1_i1.p1 TRINITY_DN33731_c0_g1~~TRINITY_DN33731_c0_g1_i1.p1  ORF type:complete len:600 (+),score=85.82 TRINITY_DN33731_c0_g1_i1:53-1852(+)
MQSQTNTPHITAVDLETVSERLHVDARALAKKLHEPVGGTSMPLDLEALCAVVEPAAASVQQVGPFEYQTAFAHPSTEQIKPARSPFQTGTQWGSFTPQHKPARKLTRWWLHDTKQKESHAECHGILIERTKEEIIGMKKGSGRFSSKETERSPLLSKWKHQFTKSTPHVVPQEHPITAYLMPLEEGRTIMAVVEESTPLVSARLTPMIMPDEIKSVEVRIREDESHQPRLYLVLEFARPLVGWLILITGVTCMAAVGPLIKIMSREQVSGFIVGSWNAQGLFMLFGLSSLIQGEIGPREIAYLKSSFGFLLLTMAGVISGLGSGAWTLSFVHTSVPQSYLFNSFHPTLIIAWRMLCNRHVLRQEQFGVLLGLGGAALSVLDGGGGDNVVLGDLLAFISSVSLCFYLLASKKARSHLPLMLNLTFVTFFSAASQSIVAHLLTPGGLTFDNHPVTGIFGWCTWEHFGLWMVINIITGIGQAGYIGALRYLNPVVVSVCMTTEPATATLFAMLLLGEGVPKMYTLIGGFFIICSSIIVSIYSTHSKDNVELDVTIDTTDLGTMEKPLTSPIKLAQKSPQLPDIKLSGKQRERVASGPMCPA